MKPVFLLALAERVAVDGGEAAGFGRQPARPVRRERDEDEKARNTSPSARLRQAERPPFRRALKATASPSGRRRHRRCPWPRPSRALRAFLELPEGRLGLEPVDQEVAGLEGRLAVRRGGDDEHDVLARLQPAIAVDDERGIDRPARQRLRLDLRQRLLRHAGIMLERHGAHVGALRIVAHAAEEHHRAADVRPPRLEGGEFGTCIEGLLLDADHGA